MLEDKQGLSLGELIHAFCITFSEDKYSTFMPFQLLVISKQVEVIVTKKSKMYGLNKDKMSVKASHQHPQG